MHMRIELDIYLIQSRRWAEQFEPLICFLRASKTHASALSRHGPDMETDTAPPIFENRMTMKTLSTPLPWQILSSTTLFATSVSHLQKNILDFFWNLPARCVSHTLKECVGYHTLTKNFVCGTLKFSKIAHWNSEKWVWDDAGGGCNVELACTGSP